ncbi:MAG: hypothetical protein Q9190_001614 [Brigantiaea leucoxantha]
MVERKRLHVSPLDSEILPAILPPILQEQATNISYHTIQTFPEKNYGYLDLPIAEAEKLKRKLNGSILKGVKIRITEARPKMVKTRAKEEQVETMKVSTPTKSPKQKQKAVKEDGVLTGVELPQGRKVRRGWTEPELKKSKNPRKERDSEKKKTGKKSSAFTEGSECLFKTTTPANGLKAEQNALSKEAPQRKRKRGDTDQNVVIHEFENTTKHASFLRVDRANTRVKESIEFVEGKGWVDGEGNVVEEEPKNQRSRAATGNKKGARLPDQGQKPARSKQLGSSDGRPDVPVDQLQLSEDATSSSGSSSDSEKSKGASPERKEKIRTNAVRTRNKGLRSKAKESEDTEDGLGIAQVRGLSITRSSPTPPQTSEPASNQASQEMHPLEALFKRPSNAASQTPKKPSLEVTTSFNFFEPDADEGVNATFVVPQTPFTQQDFQQRRLRSAAPTPDTAAPGRSTFGQIWSQGSDEEGEENDGADANVDTPLQSQNSKKDPEGEKEESQFSKWFWEHRGETNRAWKRRRREAAKEQRQRENQKRQ